MEKSMDRKLAEIRSNPNSRAFILADAKDADMAFGIGAPGKSPEAHSAELRERTLAEYRHQIRSVVRQAAVDIVLMSVSTSDRLALRERLFDDSPITPAIRVQTNQHPFLISANRIKTSHSFIQSDLSC